MPHSARLLTLAVMSTVLISGCGSTSPNISVVPTITAIEQVTVNSSPPVVGATTTPSAPAASEAAPTTPAAPPPEQDFVQALAWTRVFGTVLTDQINDVTSDQQGNLYMTCVCTLFTDASGSFIGQALRKYSAAGDLIWERPVGAASGGIFDQAVAADGAGHVAVVGNSAAASDTAFVAVYDSDGNVIWRSTLAGHLADVAADEAGNIYVAGRMLDKYSTFVRKYSSSGRDLWTNPVEGQSNGLTVKLAVGADSSLFVVGSLSNNLINQTSAGKDDIFIRHYTANGAVTQSLQWGTALDDYIAGAAVDSAGDLYLAFTNSHQVIVKYDATGNQIRSTQFAPVGNNRGIMGLAPDQRGGLFVLLSPHWPASNGGTEVRKLDAAGATIWSRAFPTSWPAAPELIATDSSGNIYLAGSTDAALPGRTEAFGAGDVFLLKLKP